MPAVAGEYGGIMVSPGPTPAGYWKYETVVGLDPIYDGPWRVCGFGWELINTTPTMYKSGSILVYQCPQQLAVGGVGIWSRYTITGLSNGYQGAACGF